MKTSYCFLALIIAPVFLHAQDTKDSAEKNWSCTLEADYYFVPGNKFQPTVTAYIDHKSLHLEARYNYEDFNTASLFAGRTWEKKGNFSFAITPMAGVAFGDSKGILPGLEFTASYAKFNFYSENEYLLDFKGRQNNFFYSWTQLSASVFKNFQAGVVAESLRLYKTKFDVQKGIYAEYAPGSFLFDVYCLNPFSKYNYWVASVSFQF